MVFVQALEKLTLGFLGFLKNNAFLAIFLRNVLQIFQNFPAPLKVSKIILCIRVFSFAISERKMFFTEIGGNSSGRQKVGGLVDALQSDLSRFCLQNSQSNAGMLSISPI